MMLQMLLVPVVALLSGMDAVVQNKETDHDRAIKAIRMLGGEVIVGPKKSGKPIAVVLTGASRANDCLPYLKRLSNLRTCDL